MGRGRVKLVKERGVEYKKGGKVECKKVEVKGG